MERDDALRAGIAANLAGFMRQAAAEPGHRAAVAVAIADAGHGADVGGLPTHREWRTQAALLLTRRAGTLRSHAGQWALPGGRIEPGESVHTAALRELAEEIGLHLPDTAVLGLLDDYVTRSGYVITPVILWAGAARELQANPHEVASIHRIPVEEFMRTDAPLLSAGPDPAKPVLRMPVGDSWIAAPTAAVLYQFREVGIAGRATRVAHFDQPGFAWR